jgi:hypothetical protein
LALNFDVRCSNAGYAPKRAGFRQGKSNSHPVSYQMQPTIRFYRELSWPSDAIFVDSYPKVGIETKLGDAIAARIS